MSLILKWISLESSNIIILFKKMFIQVDFNFHQPRGKSRRGTQHIIWKVHVDRAETGKASEDPVLQNI